MPARPNGRIIRESVVNALGKGRACQMDRFVAAIPYLQEFILSGVKCIRTRIIAVSMIMNL